MAGRNANEQVWREAITLGGKKRKRAKNAAKLGKSGRGQGRLHWVRRIGEKLFDLLVEAPFIVAASVLAAVLLAWLGFSPVSPLRTLGKHSTIAQDSSTILKAPGRETGGDSATPRRPGRVELKRDGPETHLARLAITRPRSLPVEVEVHGDSVVFDVVFERGDSAYGRWPRWGKPEFVVEVYYTKLFSVPLVDSLSLSGAWVGEQQNRAVFLAPRLRTIQKDLRIVPRVRAGSVVRFPRVSGAFAEHGGVAWIVRLTVDKNGQVKSGRWKWAPDSNAGGGV